MLETTRPYGAPVRAFVSATVHCQVAHEPWQVRGYWALRREIFCQETTLFRSQQQERDQHDRRALPIVALAHWAGNAHDVVGVVRIFSPQAGLWYGGRLGVAGAYRARGSVGAALIKTAVGSAKGLGCQRFLATVLCENALYFGRQHFQAIEQLQVCGRAHVLMQADLAAFSALPAAIGGKREAA